jgi:hypothetical protein
MKTRVPPSDDLYELEINARAPFSEAPCHVLWWIVFDLKIFHPRLCIIPLNDILSLPDKLAGNIRLFSRLESDGDEPAVGTDQKRHAIVCKRWSIESLLLRRARKRH